MRSLGGRTAIVFGGWEGCGKVETCSIFPDFAVYPNDRLRIRISGGPLSAHPMINGLELWARMMVYFTLITIFMVPSPTLDIWTYDIKAGPSCDSPHRTTSQRTMTSSHTLPITADYFAHTSAWPSTSSSLRGHRAAHDTQRGTDTELGIELDSLGPSSSVLPPPSTVSYQFRVPSRGELALYRFAVYWPMFIQGWNDATAGPLLPTIQAQYGLNFTKVSMLFVASSIVRSLSRFTHLMAHEPDH